MFVCQRHFKLEHTHHGLFNIWTFHPTGFLLMDISKFGVHYNYYIIFLFYPLLTLKPFALPLGTPSGMRVFSLQLV